MSPPDDSELRASEGAFREPVRAALPHEPFFKALAALGGHEGERDWRALTAGLVTLRVADRRLACVEDCGGLHPGREPTSGLVAGVPPDVVEAARAAANAVDRRDVVASPLRELARSVGGVVVDDLPHRLLAYANALHADSRWQLAADVYRTLLQFANTPRPDGTSAPRPFVPHVYDRLGRSLRMTGALDEARAAYAAGRAVARALGDENADRLIRISEAKILMYLGNLPAAAVALDGIIRDATGSGTAIPPDWATAARQEDDSDAAVHDRFNVVALARHDRAAVATLLHDFNLAAEQYFAAWQSYRDPIRRERVWVDMALNFAEMGLRDVAREALQVLVVGARRREIKLVAATNLLELAIADGREDLFEIYCGTLHDAAMMGTLPAELAAKFALYEGRGEARFGRMDKAVSAFERALSLGIAHHVHEVTIRSDEALAAVRSGQSVGRRVEPVQASNITPSVKRIARVVRRARRRAGTPR
jgi:tetratricopeptide (TPR) repeat protein